KSRRKPPPEPIMARSSSWMRAPQSGIFRAYARLGDRVTRDQTVLGAIADPFGESEQEIRAPFSGIVIGRLNLPLVNEGDAVFHIARFYRTDIAVERIEDYQESIESDKFPWTDDAHETP
ncbi:MAG TPA: succinylglutamate desuccinylase/aspartoacylase family protein, partial [Wenzhouxiangella sp.]|nr:succinylglutamate desuccinylase/aspartoacylase family protein [Wenzhouxiangella sp.]